MQHVKKGLLSVLVIGALSSTVQAFTFEGGYSGGGGNAVVCFKTDVVPDIAEKVREGKGVIPDAWLSEIASIETLDLWEARLPRGLPARTPTIVDIKDNEAGFKSYVNQVAERAFRVSYDIHSVIEDTWKSVGDDQIIFYRTPIQQLRDVTSAGIIDSGKCAIVTIAAQDIATGNLYINIDDRLYSHPKHSELSKGVLLLHEAMYFYSRKRGETTSDKTRKMVGSLISIRENYQYRTLLRDARLFGFLKAREIKSDSAVGSSKETAEFIENMQDFRESPIFPMAGMWTPRDTRDAYLNFKSLLEGQSAKIAALEGRANALLETTSANRCTGFSYNQSGNCLDRLNRLACDAVATPQKCEEKKAIAVEMHGLTELVIKEWRSLLFRDPEGKWDASDQEYYLKEQNFGLSEDAQKAIVDTIVKYFELLAPRYVVTETGTLKTLEEKNQTCEQKQHCAFYRILSGRYTFSDLFIRDKSMLGEAKLDYEAYYTLLYKAHASTSAKLLDQPFN